MDGRVGILGILGILVFLTVIVRLSSEEMHCLRYFFTAATPGIDFTEYTVEGRLDGEPFVHYDSKSKKMIPKTEWIKKAIPDHWDRETDNLQDVAKNFKDEVVKAMQSFNNAEGGHTMQWMYGCELDGDGTKIGYWQCGYNGKYVISLELKNGTWTAGTPLSEITKEKWEKTKAAGFLQAYLENECISSLQNYVHYKRSTVENKGSQKHWSPDENTGCKARQVASPSQDGVSVGIIIGVVVAGLLLLVGVGVGVVIWKKCVKKSDFRSVPGNLTAYGVEQAVIEVSMKPRHE